MSARSVEKQFIILGADGIGVGCVFADELRPDEYGATPQAVKIYRRGKSIAGAWYGAKEWVDPDSPIAQGAANSKPRETERSDTGCLRPRSFVESARKIVEGDSGV